jgi:nitrate/nitrite transporter NarK
MAALLQRLPWLLFGLYAGVIADRLDRRAIVIVTGLVRVVILVLLTTLIVTRHVDVALVLAVLFLFGVTETFGETTTGTLLPMLVDKPNLGIAPGCTTTFSKGAAGCGGTPRSGRWPSRSSPSTSPSARPGRCWSCTRASGWAWARSASG